MTDSFSDRKHDPDGVDVAIDLVESLASMTPAIPLPPPRIGPAKHKARRSGDLEPIGDVVGQMAAQLGWQGQLSLRVIAARWAELAGDVNAAHSQPVALDGTVVTVSAESSTWASALRLYAPQLVAKLNDALGQGSITKVDVRGPGAPSWKHGQRSVRDGRGPRDTYG